LYVVKFLAQLMTVTDRRTDRQTNRMTVAYIALPCNASRGKNGEHKTKSNQTKLDANTRGVHTYSSA